MQHSWKCAYFVYFLRKQIICFHDDLAYQSLSHAHVKGDFFFKKSPLSELKLVGSNHDIFSSPDIFSDHDICGVIEKNVVIGTHHQHH